MSYSFKTLGSNELQSQVLKDIDDLFRSCQLEKLIPICLVVGKTFLLISCAQYVKEQLKIKDWEYQVSNNYEKLSEMHKELILNTLRKCERDSGIFDISDDLLIYFDPDEEYISMQVINPELENLDEESIEILKYEEDDILSEFDPKISTQ